MVYPFTDPANIPRTKKRCNPKKISIGKINDKKAAPVRICQFCPRGSIRFVICTVSTGCEPRKILEAIVEKRVPVIMSYQSRGRWHVSKLLATSVGAGIFTVEVSPRKKPQPVNICSNQSVGIAVKYGYGKYIFETRVISLEPSNQRLDGGTILLAMPSQMQMIQRRSFFRVRIPESLHAEVALWHRGDADGSMISHGVVSSLPRGEAGLKFAPVFG